MRLHVRCTSNLSFLLGLSEQFQKLRQFEYHHLSLSSLQQPASVTIIITTTSICHYHHYNHHHLSLSSLKPPASVTIIIKTTSICHYHHHNHHHLSLSSLQPPASVTIIITTTENEKTSGRRRQNWRFLTIEDKAVKDVCLCYSRCKNERKAGLL